MSAQELIDTIISNGKTPCFEINDSVFYIEAKENKLIAGTGTNSGIIPLYEMDYDADFSHDENLQALFELVSESEMNND